MAPSEVPQGNPFGRMYKFAELIRDVSHGPGLSVEFLACRRTLFCARGRSRLGNGRVDLARFTEPRASASGCTPAQTEAGVARPRWYDRACVSSSLQCWLWARTGRSGFRRTLFHKGGSIAATR